MKVKAIICLVYAIFIPVPAEFHGSGDSPQKVSSSGTSSRKAHGISAPKHTTPRGPTSKAFTHTDYNKEQ